MQDKIDYKLTYNTDLVKDGTLNFVDENEFAIDGMGGTIGSLSSLFR
jgi:hypothetical protein